MKPRSNLPRRQVIDTDSPCWKRCSALSVRGKPCRKKADVSITTEQDDKEALCNIHYYQLVEGREVRLSIKGKTVVVYCDIEGEK